MPWQSPRTLRWSNSSHRTVWWIRKTLNEFKKSVKKQEAFNMNANTWRWIYDFLTQEWNYRRQMPLGSAPLVPRKLRQEFRDSPTALELEAKYRRSFNEWLAVITPMYFGVELIYIAYTNRVYPKKYTAGIRDRDNRLTYVTLMSFESMKAAEEVRWCHIKKDWYYTNAFSTVFTYAQTESGGYRRKTVTVAAPQLFTCPICTDTFLQASENMKQSQVIRNLFVCPVCVTKPLKNKPLTQDTVYGDYHSHGRSGGWRFFPHQGKKDFTVPLGIELEMQFKSGRAAPRALSWDMYKHQLKKNPDWNLFYCERDGSIGEFGLEMITQPMSQTYHNTFWDHMLPFIREHFTGWNTERKHPSGQYGIHVTFDSKTFGQLNLARLIKFVENRNNQGFIQGLAQRGVIYQGDSEGIASKTKKISQVVYYDRKKGMLGSINRNQPINLKGEKGLCEVRMFRSTLNHTSFMKNLEFFWAFHQWCGETSFSFSAVAFQDWMLKNPNYYFNYPHLYKYLCHTEFPVKIARVPVTNPYANAFSQIVIAREKGQKDFFETSVKVDGPEEPDNPTNSADADSTF